MQMKRFIIPLLAAVAVFTATAQTWSPDSLCRGFESRRVKMADDYSGPVVSTIIRKLAPGENVRRGVLYVHGFNDYFFQSEMGEEFVSHGYDFYAVDLRKYGRSLLPGQKRYQCRSISEYFPDIDSALVDMGRNGISEIVLMGHSTGGLITACYLNSNERPQIKALILNSPFLDWNLGRLEKVIPLVTWWGKLFPNTKISQGKSTAYAESLLKRYHGEWSYDTRLKLIQSPDVDAGWVRAITEAQRSLRDGKARISQPILLMYSAQSVDSSEWSPEHNRADGVLDVRDIKRFGMELGPHVTLLKVPGGLHDLVLSAPGVRYPLYNHIFSWLGRIPSLNQSETESVSTKVRAA